MTDQTLIIANWKSHFSQAQALSWLTGLADTWQPAAGVSVVLAPPLTLVGAVDWYTQHTEHFSAEQKAALKLAVQDLSPFPAGAYTGAVSTPNLEGFSVQYAILGHSERRRYFHETHTEVANKTEQALAAGITPILCLDVDYVEAQAAALPKEVLSQVVVAYEPLEAIGSGQSQPVAEVEKVVEEIKAVYGSVPVIYGGSVTDHNVAEYLTVCQGVLVGGASLDVKKFERLLKAA